MTFESNLSLASGTTFLPNFVGDAHDLLTELLKTNNRKFPLNGWRKTQ